MIFNLDYPLTPIWLGLLLGGLAAPLCASDRDKVDVFSLSLEELLLITVASKHAETIREAPSVVSVITSQDIQNFGARTLGDLIDRLPNTQLIGSNAYPHNHTSMRGVTQTHLDDKVLLLLNGRPLRDAGQGGVNGDIYSSFPLISIKQIEVIRGPGSVLYGTNAFAGVINIVTNNEQDIQGLQLDVMVGSFDSRQVSLSGASGDESSGISGALIAHHDNGDVFHNLTGEVGDPGSYTLGRESISMTLQGHHRGFSFNTLLDDVKQGNAHNYTSFPSTDWEMARRFLDIGYTLEAFEDWTLKANITYNGMENRSYFAEGSNLFFTTTSRGYLGELQASRSFSDNVSLLIGGVYDKLLGDNLSNGEYFTDIDISRRSFYTQVDYQLSEWLNINGGFQLNQPEGADIDMSPRAAAIFNISQRHTLKLMYDKAYRSPFGLDLFLNAEFFQGNPNLKPETIKTLSAQWLYETEAASYSFTLYNSKHEDLIVRAIVNSTTSLGNNNEMRYRGAEFEYKQSFYNNWSMQGNASHQTNKSDSGQKNITWQPEWMVKSGLVYDNDLFTGGLYISYFGEPTQVRELNPAVIEANPSANAYTQLTANIRVDLARMLNKPKYQGARLELFIDNLLDEDIYYSEFNRKKVNSLPHGDGRGAYLTVSFPF